MKKHLLFAVAFIVGFAICHQVDAQILGRLRGGRNDSGGCGVSNRSFIRIESNGNRINRNVQRDRASRRSGFDSRQFSRRNDFSFSSGFDRGFSSNFSRNFRNQVDLSGFAGQFELGERRRTIIEEEPAIIEFIPRVVQQGGVSIREEFFSDRFGY